MLSYVDPLLIVTAFWLAWDYRQPAPLLPFDRAALTPVTLEDQRTVDWLAGLRTGLLAPNPGTRAKSGYLARRKTDSGHQPRQYTRDR
jgi:hypothetical protein